MESMRGMLAGPLSGDEPLDPGVLNDAQAAVDALNQLHMAKQGVKAQELLQPWVTSEQSMMDLYSRGYAQQFQLTSELSERYGVEDLWDEFAVLPGALMVLKSGLCPFVTVTIDGFDTHEDHLTSHTALLRSFGTGLSALVEDLQATPDPDDPERSLAETTTIAITSEFVRTPLFNLADGTDHWPSGSMILMGRGIQDGVVVGATGDDAFALGWANDAAVERDATTALKPEHVVATVLDIAGLGSEALSEISEVRIDALRG